MALAADVVAGLSLPGFDNSAMDGYAVLAADVVSASADDPVRLPVVEDIPAGRTDLLALAPHTAHRIMTGAPVPAGATAVVPVEATDGGTETVRIRASARPGQHIRRAGEDVTAGTTVMHAGQVVSPAALGLAAALGIGELTVRPRQRVLVMSTGTELIAPGAELKPGQIYESNAVMLAAAVREAGGVVTAAPMAEDDVDEFRAALQAHVGESDLIITTGGVSAGAYEVVKDALGVRSISSRSRCSRGCRRAAGTSWSTAARCRSSRFPETPSARWCPSRCSSVRRCGPLWICRSRTGVDARRSCANRARRRGASGSSAAGCSTPKLAP